MVSEVVVLNVVSDSSEVLDTVSRGSEDIRSKGKCEGKRYFQTKTNSNLLIFPTWLFTAFDTVKGQNFQVFPFFVN